MTCASRHRRSASSSTGAAAATPQDVIREVYRASSSAASAPIWITLLPEADAIARCSNAAERAALRHAVRGQGQHRRGRPADDMLPARRLPIRRSARRPSSSCLEAAGAILIGKTNLDQFATGLVGTRSPYGIPANTFNPEIYLRRIELRIGGRSRQRARVVRPWHGHRGLWPRASGFQQHCRAEANQGPDQHARRGAGLPLAGYRIDFRFDGCRCRACFRCCIGVRCEGRVCATRRVTRTSSAGVRTLAHRRTRRRSSFLAIQTHPSLYASAITRAEALGAEIVEIDFTPFQQAASLLYQGPWVAERLAAINDFASTHPHEMHEVVGKIILSARGLTAVDAFEGAYRLAELVRAAEAEWQKMDMLLLPTAPTIYKIADVLADPVRLNSNLGLYTNFVNLMDLSALAVPAGFRSDGLPFGITLIGRACEDDRLAQFGDRMHRAMVTAKLGATEIALDTTPAIAGTQNAHQQNPSRRGRRTSDRTTAP